jgi:hypothetical protein
MAKLGPNAKAVERVDAATGSRFIEELDLAVNRTTKEVDKSYGTYLCLYQAISGTEEEPHFGAPAWLRAASRCPCSADGRRIDVAVA